MSSIGGGGAAAAGGARRVAFQGFRPSDKSTNPDEQPIKKTVERIHNKLSASIPTDGSALKIGEIPVYGSAPTPTETSFSISKDAFGINIIKDNNQSSPYLSISNDGDIQLSRQDFKPQDSKQWNKANFVLNKLADKVDEQQISQTSTPATVAAPNSPNTQVLPTPLGSFGENTKLPSYYSDVFDTAGDVITLEIGKQYQDLETDITYEYRKDGLFEYLGENDGWIKADENDVTPELINRLELLPDDDDDSFPPSDDDSFDLTTTVQPGPTQNSFKTETPYYDPVDKESYLYQPDGTFINFDNKQVSLSQDILNRLEQSEE